MEKSNLKQKDVIPRAQALLKELEAGNDKAASELIDELSVMKERELFQGIGKLTRNLHDTVSDFFDDTVLSKFSNIDQQEFPDALERLNYVIQMTEESANTTLTVVEETIPLSENIENRGNELRRRWGDLRSRKLTLNEFKQLSNDIEDYLDYSIDMSVQLSSKLNEVLLAQGFQDLTGQMIKRVITLVENVEDSLVELIAAASDRQSPPDQTTQQSGSDPNTKGEGPALPSTKEGVAKGQDEVDDLLASLGF
ncbi:MAG: protein phosphatase CheZ [Gammaproteobacteria bacterium]|nr:protein phosphatase CheZ [Gammaproteobacteria bacterium]